MRRCHGGGLFEREQLGMNGVGHTAKLNTSEDPTECTSTDEVIVISKTGDENEKHGRRGVSFLYEQKKLEELLKKKKSSVKLIDKVSSDGKREESKCKEQIN